MKALGTDGVIISKNNALSRAMLIGSHGGRVAHLSYKRSHMAGTVSLDFGLFLCPGVVRACCSVFSKHLQGVSCIDSFTHSLSHSFIHSPRTYVLHSFHMSDTALVAAGGDDKVPALMKIAF